jgi:hypothetical protein
MSLIEKAKQLTRQGSPYSMTPDTIALCVSWAHGEVSLTQVAHALDRKINTSIYSYLARGLRYAVQTGVLVEPDIPHANWREGDRSEDCPFEDRSSS